MRKPKHPWLNLLAPDDVVRSASDFPGGAYLDLFEERLFPAVDERVGDIRYFVYDPTRHGAPAGRAYPVLYAFHGMGGSHVGREAIGWSAAEMFASPDAQKRLGGAYIVAPLANETAENDMSWMTPIPREGDDLPAGYAPEQARVVKRYAKRWQGFTALLGNDSVYTETLRRLLDAARATFDRAGKTVLLGTSAGGYAAWRLLLGEPERFAAAILMAAAYLPSVAELSRLDAAGTPVLLCHGLNDELVPFDLAVLPALPTLCQMSGVTSYFPRFVRNGDRSVLSNLLGDQEIGQHCINNAVSQNLVYDDGVPYDPRLPDGVTGWLMKSIG